MEMAYCRGIFRFPFKNTQIITVEMGKKMNGLQGNPFNKLWLKMFNHSVIGVPVLPNMPYTISLPFH